MEIRPINIIPHMENREWLVPLDQINVVIEAIIPILEEHNTLILQGEMGAGKTSFAVSLLKKIGIQDPEGSPTYSIINEYVLPNQKKLYHIDAYRIKDNSEAFSLGLDELFEENAIFIVEWAEKIAKFLPEQQVTLTILNDSIDERTYILNHGNRS